MSQIHTRPALIPFQEISHYASDRVWLDQVKLRELDNLNAFKYSQRPTRNEDLSWQAGFKVSTMSGQKSGPYDVPPARVGDDYQTRPDISQRPAREQLPPLSSIFPESRSGAVSPYQNTNFPLNISPREHHRSSASVKSLPEPPSWESTTLQRHPSQSSSQFSYEGRPALSTTQSDLPPPPPGPLQINRPPISPRILDPQRFSPPNSGSRIQLPLSRTGWSPRSEPPYREYFPTVSRDIPASFKSQPEQNQPLPLSRRGSEARQMFLEGPQASDHQQNPPTPASTASDLITTKDGLGPKIWTGTQFLPRYVQSADVAGEGLCYFYDDGSHCKTHIDGEAVNAHWGVTKAGKPRKRLAIACITCREKKIKCDPDYPRCIQCEKFGRVCKFKNAPRGGQGSPETPPREIDEASTRPVSSRSDEDLNSKVEARVSLPSFATSGGHAITLTEAERDSKRRRYNSFTPLNIEMRSEFSHPNVSPAEGQQKGRRSSVELYTQWNMNPYDSNENQVLELMRTYFTHIASATYDMFPEKPFMAWVMDRCAMKSREDLMLIYSMLALATVFSSNIEQKRLGEFYAEISRYACDNRHFSLQLVQSRLLLSMYYYANNNPNDSWDFCGSALRAATGMKLNQEIETTDDSRKETFPFNLTRPGYAECRRRTFWSAYIMDKFNGFCSGHLSVLHPEDIFLRLPCDVKSFNDQVDVTNPFFDPNSHPNQNSLSTIGAMAYLVNITSIWGDVMADVYRSSQRPEGCAPQTLLSPSDFHSTMSRRLERWSASLSPCLANNPENALASAKYGIGGMFVTMHSLYHITHMKLNRYFSTEVVGSRVAEDNIRTAYKHAEDLLQLLNSVADASDPDFEPLPCSSPFVGYAVVSAVDILSAKGDATRLSELPPRFSSATRILNDLAEYWQSARNQKEVVAARIMDLVRVDEGWRDDSVVRVDNNERWEMLGPIERMFKRATDCVYSEGFDNWRLAMDVK